MREVTDEQRDGLIALVFQKQWLEGDIGNPEHQGRSETIADAVIADGWRLLPTRSELTSVVWGKGNIHIDEMIAAGFAREDPDGN